jgi:hypothetical protein
MEPARRMSRRRENMDRVREICETALAANAIGAWSLIPKVEVKPARAPIEIPSEGLIVLRDLGLKTVDAEFGRGADKIVKDIEQTIAIEAYIADQAGITAADALAGLMATIGEAIESDPTLSGLVDESDISESDDESFGDLGSDTIAGQQVMLAARWSSERSLG